MLAKLRESPQLASSLEKAIADPECKAFSAALKVLTDYDTTKPAQKQEIVGPLVVTVRFAREGKRVTAS